MRPKVKPCLHCAAKSFAVNCQTTAAVRTPLTLQVKSEDWGGLFIDFVEQAVADRAVFKLIAVPRSVSVVGRVYSRYV